MMEFFFLLVFQSRGGRVDFGMAIWRVSHADYEFESCPDLDRYSLTHDFTVSVGQRWGVWGSPQVFLFLLTQEAAIAWLPLVSRGWRGGLCVDHRVVPMFDLQAQSCHLLLPPIGDFTLLHHRLLQIAAGIMIKRQYTLEHVGQSSSLATYKQTV